ncbi:hypothetical protein K443DRAFT_680289 [Laccaria amethystina LaAM-08-1]|uniref:RRM Nup35-type domain-containing protein n=1 Tax=Laccaria amethystina LaAM-08-1 TaxID=1095629 RepID=A0A0C9XNA4_9AGAR|nr:hypothetical protein K443DRAFT_680289 [Laccaria amethystina LaAM-08-1]
MSSSAASHHGPNLNAWGSASTSGSTFGESLSQSRSHYQSGYLMSTSQSNQSPQGNQRADEVPVVQTKAKMNQVLSRADFGMDSMFQSSRQRQALADEDAPPMTSVNDIPNEIILDSPNPTRFQPRNSAFGHRKVPSASAQIAQHQPLYVVVFGYPADKYSVTVEYFKSLGDATDVEHNSEISNCFRIGYRDPGDAMRAVRKNGEVLGGSWMVGAKWADAAQAEALLGQPVTRVNGSAAESPANAMAVDEPISPSNVSSSSVPHTPTVGTPIRLAPSALAFKKTGAASAAPSKPSVTPRWGTPGGVTPGTVPAGGDRLMSSATPPSVQASPSKGVIGQVSDLLFGW